jgi:hypothetical protein
MLGYGFFPNGLDNWKKQKVVLLAGLSPPAVAGKANNSRNSHLDLEDALSLALTSRGYKVLSQLCNP